MVGVGVGVGVGVAVGVAVGVGLGVGDTAAVGLGLWLGVGETDAFAVGVAVGLLEGVAEGFTVGLVPGGGVSFGLAVARPMPARYLLPPYVSGPPTVFGHPAKAMVPAMRARTIPLFRVFLPYFGIK
jgi:hypothetical protein